MVHYECMHASPPANAAVNCSSSLSTQQQKQANIVKIGVYGREADGVRVPFLPRERERERERESWPRLAAHAGGPTPAKAAAESPESLIHALSQGVVVTGRQQKNCLSRNYNFSRGSFISG